MKSLKVLAGTLGVATAVTAAAVAATSRTTASEGTGVSHLAASANLVPMFKGIQLKQFLTVGDSVPKTGGTGTYRMAGLPDGLGAFDNGDGTFTVLVNHELSNTLGVARAHGGKGAFVSKWVVNKKDLSIVSGEDLIKNVYRYVNGAYVLDPAYAFTRFCSADLAPLSAFYSKDSKKGYNGRLFLNGEESGAEGAAWAHEMSGSSWELPFLGKFSWENALANWGTHDRTVVIGQDDAGGDRGQVYMYVGDKQLTGDAVTRAGLSGGNLYGIQVTGFPFEPTVAAGIPTTTNFTLYNFTKANGMTGAALEAASNTNNVTQFQRPEDGAWDPNNANVYYFVTTDQFAGTSRLWRLTFKDVEHTPEAGGTIEMLLAGNEGQQMFDNLAIDKTSTRIILNEDIGNEAARGKVWKYVIATDFLSDVVEHDSKLFQPGESGYITMDEETSGTIDMTDILGAGWFLMTDQVHLPTAPAGFTAPAAATTFPYNDTELVEGGSLIAAYFPMWKPKKAATA